MVFLKQHQLGSAVVLKAIPVIHGIMSNRDNSLAVCFVHVAVRFLVPVHIKDTQALIQAGRHDKTCVSDADCSHGIPMAKPRSL